jgi:hypothetical protein
VPFDLRGTAAAGLLVGAVGALLAGSAMVLSRTRRRRAAVRLAGSAAARP